MTTIAQLPFHLQGDLYKTMMDEFDELDNTKKMEECVIPRPIKTDSTLTSLRDLFELIDTCAYLLVDLPMFAYDFVYRNQSVLCKQMEYLEEHSPLYLKYAFFMTLPEYHALKLLANFSLTQNMGIYAIMNGSLELFKYYEHHTTDTLTLSLYNSVFYDQPEIIQYLSKRPLFADIIKQEGALLCSTAAARGNLKTLHYLHETLELEWSSKVISEAIQSSQYECLVYALQQGCPVGTFAISLAIQNESPLFLQALVEIGGITIDYDWVRMNYPNVMRGNLHKIITCGGIPSIRIS